MSEPTTLKAATDAERNTLRAILARGEEEWKECPCGWFFKEGARCPDKACKKWKPPTGKKIVKLYAHANDEGWVDDGKKLGLEGDPLRRFINWGYEIEFDGEVDLQTGEVKLLTVNGHKIQY